MDINALLKKHLEDTVRLCDKVGDLCNKISNTKNEDTKQLYLNNLSEQVKEIEEGINIFYIGRDYVNHPAEPDCIKILQDRIIELKDWEAMYYFAGQVKGADHELLYNEIKILGKEYEIWRLCTEH